MSGSIAETPLTWDWPAGRRRYDEKFYRQIEEGALRSARVIVPLVMELAAPRSVVDVGCATGSWLSVFRELGITDVRGVDSTAVPRHLLRIAPEQFTGADLRQPVSLGRQFDLAMSVEVAEHLPQACAAAFIESLTKLAPVVMFSAAIPHQGGTGHRNEQWPEYWAERFAARGYVAVDALRPQIWNDADVNYWYAQNLLLYVRGDALRDYPLLEARAAATDPRHLTRVHPGAYLRVADPANLPAQELLRAPLLLARRLWRRLFLRR